MCNIDTEERSPLILLLVSYNPIPMDVLAATSRREMDRFQHDRNSGGIDTLVILVSAPRISSPLTSRARSEIRPAVSIKRTRHSPVKTSSRAALMCVPISISS